MLRLNQRVRLFGIFNGASIKTTVSEKKKVTEEEKNNVGVTIIE
jgi:hypothetical protein